MNPGCKILIPLLLVFAMQSFTAADDSTWNPQALFWPDVVRSIPDTLKSQDAKTGRFGTGIWIVTDQNVMFPLAVAWAVKDPDNPYYQSDDLLNSIMAAGDALIEDQDERGQWEFRKKDGSTWGKIYMPWIYSRWVRAFGLIRDAMPAERRQRWEAALTLGFSGISKSALGHVHNIPAHHAMGLYHAGQVLDRKEWCDQARVFMAKVVRAQNVGGYWSEHVGPVVGYNLVYTDALGVYYAISHDETVLPALQRAAAFHAAFTYPDGSRVETVDERNPYHAGVSLGTVGFTFSEVGRRFVDQQLERLRANETSVGGDVAASFVLYGQSGPMKELTTNETFILGKNDAATRLASPWFTCLSAFHCSIPENRWIQDRQNFVSLFHERVGLIIGGGNTKLQPRWSTFSVGDPSLLVHKAGDTRPKFTPPEGLVHVPDETRLLPGVLQLDFKYGKQPCSVRVDISDPEQAKLVFEANVASGQAVEAHVTLMPHIGSVWETSSGITGELGKEPINWQAHGGNSWFAHHGWRLTIPDDASIQWPALPHNPYRKDGRATHGEGRIVLTLPFDQDHSKHTVIVEVP